MIDFHREIVAALESTGLPVHYEMVLHSGLSTPCISYMELNNYVTLKTDKTDYSIISYQVKVWGNNIGELQKYALMIDSALRPLGFKRISTGELYDINSTMIQKITTYEATAKETY